jgi:heme/copper-type cytochrome/quinol oxidase subunit 2
MDRIKNSRSITFICTSIPKYSSKLYFITVFFKLVLSQTRDLKSTLSPLGVNWTILAWHWYSTCIFIFFWSTIMCFICNDCFNPATPEEPLSGSQMTKNNVGQQWEWIFHPKAVCSTSIASCTWCPLDKPLVGVVLFLWDWCM